MLLAGPNRREASPTGRLTTSLSNEDDWPRAADPRTSRKRRSPRSEKRGYGRASDRGRPKILSGGSVSRKLIPMGHLGKAAKLFTKSLWDSDVRIVG